MRSWYNRTHYFCICIAVFRFPCGERKDFHRVVISIRDLKPWYFLGVRDPECYGWGCGLGLGRFEESDRSGCWMILIFFSVEAKIIGRRAIQRLPSLQLNFHPKGMLGLSTASCFTAS